MIEQQRGQNQRFEDGDDQNAGAYGQTVHDAGRYQCADEQTDTAGGVEQADADGKRGYGVGWDSVRSDMAGGTGFARILKFDEAKPLAWNTTGKQLSNTPSGHPALDDETPARFELTLRDGVLTLKVDGKVIATAKDQNFGKFNRIYLRGNQSQILDNIVVTP